MDYKNLNPGEELLRRAYKQKISIAQLCRLAGVSRSWFERLKKHPPKGLEAYMKMDKLLMQMEKNKLENKKTP